MKCGTSSSRTRVARTLAITPTISTVDGAATITLSTNEGVRIYSDGTNYYTLRGKLRTLLNTDLPSSVVVATPAFAATLTLDLSTIKDGGIFRVTLTGNVTIQLSNGTDGQRFVMELTQDATGSRLVTLSGTYFRFGTDITSFTATTTGNKMDRIGCFRS